MRTVSDGYYFYSFGAIIFARFRPCPSRKPVHDISEINRAEDASVAMVISELYLALFVHNKTVR